MMRSTQAFTLARMSVSGNRRTRQPRRESQASLRSSLAFCFSSPCQYAPSASTASCLSGNAISTVNCPIRYSVANEIARALSSSWSAFSRLLVRGQVDAANAPEHRREQNRKRETSDGLTWHILPHISQAIRRRRRMDRLGDRPAGGDPDRRDADCAGDRMSRRLSIYNGPGSWIVYDMDQRRNLTLVICGRPFRQNHRGRWVAVQSQ